MSERVSHHYQSQLEHRSIRQPVLALPPAFERKQSLDVQAIDTAGHELNHALVAMKCGITIDHVSVVPIDNSLGRTVFKGSIDPDTFKVIAAGGAVDTPHGKASGYGMDLHMITLLNHAYGGGSPSDYISRASSHISSVPLKVRERASEIIAFYREVNGGMLTSIINHAEYEVALEENRDVSVYLQSPEENTSNQKKVTEVVHGKNNIYTISISEDGELESQYTYCGVCGGVDIHSLGCPHNPFNRAFENDGEKLELPTESLEATVIDTLQLPKKGTIFIRR